ncbi:hypothetical protein AMR94_16995 [Bacillus sp. G3(2015)]|uniref:hypothetical protein n=1 Tax=Bacillus sp. G3(2015) TaxID=1706731 RepID=UPI000738A2C3|nr:hypothetical protein [Bacillus sp. G3(2015)]KUF29523.1 hypothetical protein AMR94_16995 [Bacillus sp. G3(2015)]
MFRKIAIIFCSFVVILMYSNVSVYADSPSMQLVGSGGVIITKQTFENGSYVIDLKVDNDEIYVFQLSELHLVNDCTFQQSATVNKRPEQNENKFGIKVNRNGTYAFYIFANGKKVGHVRFKIKGFAENGQATKGETKWRDKLAEYYGVPDDGNAEHVQDKDAIYNGVCVNDNVDDNKPIGSGEIEKPKEDNNNGGNGNNESNEKLEKALKDISDSLKSIDGSTRDTAKNTKDIADSNKKIADAVDSIKDTVGEILKEMKPTTDVVIDELKKPDLITPKDENEKFEDKNEYFKEGKEEKVPTDALPDAPDPKPWKDEDGKEMTKEDKSEKDKPTEKDKPSEKDKPTEKDKPSEKDKTPEKDKPTEKDKPSDRDKPTEKDKPSERDKPSGKDKTPDRDGIPSKDKTPDRDGTPSRDKTPDRDSPSSRDKTPDRDRPTGKDGVPDREQPVGRDPVMSRDPFLTRDPVLR